MNNKKKKKKMNKFIKTFLPLFNIVLVCLMATYAYLQDSVSLTNSFKLALDEEPPIIDSFTFTKTKTAITMNITAHDEFRGLASIKWYYGKCDGECNVDEFTELTETIINPPTTESVTESKTTVECLTYGTYTIYAVLEDEVGNKVTTDMMQVTLDVPDAENVSYDNTNSGSTCTTVDCALDELYEIYDENP